MSRDQNFQRIVFSISNLDHNLVLDLELIRVKLFASNIVRKDLNMCVLMKYPPPPVCGIHVNCHPDDKASLV